MSTGAHSSKSKAHNKARKNKGKAREIFLEPTGDNKVLKRQDQHDRVEITDRSLDEVLGSINSSLREQTQRYNPRERR